MPAVATATTFLPSVRDIVRMVVAGGAGRRLAISAGCVWHEWATQLLIGVSEF